MSERLCSVTMLQMKKRFTAHEVFISAGIMCAVTGKRMEMEALGRIALNALVAI